MPEKARIGASASEPRQHILNPKVVESELGALQAGCSGFFEHQTEHELRLTAAVRKRNPFLCMAVTHLPSGTVTFLFTDIEGSTRLLDELGERVRRGAGGAPARSARGVRGATAASRSRRRATPSSSPSPPPPRRSRPQAQGSRRSARDRSRCGWASIPASRRLTGDGYVGLDVHRAARSPPPGTAARSLVSQTTRDARRRRLRDLGGTG